MNSLQLRQPAAESAYPAVIIELQLQKLAEQLQKRRRTRSARQDFNHNAHPVSAGGARIVRVDYEVLFAIPSACSCERNPLCDLLQKLIM